MKNLSKTEKENIVKRCLSGEGITVLANEYGISRGSIYSELKIVQPFSKAGVPYDNSVCESFFKNMKTEELYRKDYTSEKHFRKSVNDYIRFYNHDRPHSANINCTPDQKEAQYFANHLDDQ